MTVRLIFKMFIEGCGYDRIIDELNMQGFKTKSGKYFGHNSLHNIVRNEKYTGVFVFNKLVSKDMDGKRNGNAYKEPEEVIRVEGAVPAIISMDEFISARNKILLRKQGRAANNAIEVYLLSGKIFCGECGGAFVGNRKYAGRNKTLQVTSEKGILQEQLKHISNTGDPILDENLFTAFSKAKTLLSEGKLTTTKSLIEIFIEKVLIYENHINILLRHHPGESAAS